jgi:Xaa-Pro aminopeptidase
VISLILGAGVPAGQSDERLSVATEIDYEATGPNYAAEKLLDVRERVHQAIGAISAKIAPGMTEEDAVEMARDILGEMGMRKGWHRVIVRFGANTTKDFMAESEPGVVLREQDIFFLDIGPVYGDTEGDAGQTFVFGDDPEHHKAASDVRLLWDEVREQWLMAGLTGTALYDYAVKRAGELGWELNLDLSGHRLGDFPHEALYDGSLADAGIRPRPNLWVLEIAIRHRTRPFGAFYEDLLLTDQSFAS